MEKFRESASWLNRTLFSMMVRFDFNRRPVSADPVKATAH